MALLRRRLALLLSAAAIGAAVVARTCGPPHGASNLSACESAVGGQAASLPVSVFGVPLADFVSNHRVFLAANALMGLNILWAVARSYVSSAVSKHPALKALRALPLLELATPPPKPISGSDLKLLIGMYAFVTSFYCYILLPEGRFYPEGEEELFVIRYRLELLIGAMAAMTVMYYAAARALRPHMRHPVMLDMQAANVVRVSVKCVSYVYMLLKGNFWYIHVTPVAELRDADFEVIWIGCWWMSALYTWECVFRLHMAGTSVSNVNGVMTTQFSPRSAPIVFIHHCMALIACWASMEWFGPSEGHMALRKLAPVGVVMSFTEGWFCLIVLLGSTKGCSLRQWSRVMMGNFAACVVVYHAIAAWWVATIWMNWAEMPALHRCVSSPMILALCYVAQINMMKGFKSLSHSLADEADAHEAKTGRSGDIVAAPWSG